MSIASWKKEFYSEIPEDGKSMTKTQVIKHSLKKWTGLTKKNLFEHELQRLNGVLYDDKGDTFYIDDGSCALCEKYITYREPEGVETFSVCRNCPLYKSLGKECSDGKTSPFAKWALTGNANLMIKELQKLLEKPNKK